MSSHLLTFQDSRKRFVPGPPQRRHSNTLSSSALFNQTNKRFFYAANYGNQCEDPYPSLSEFHDYEPNLEFDDSDLQRRHSEQEDCGNNNTDDIYHMSHQQVSPEDDDFENALTLADALTESLQITAADSKQPEDFSDIARLGIVDVVGDDMAGRKIIIISACRLPPRKDYDNNAFFRYLTYTLDQYVDIDYTLVYFHHGLNSRNKPSLRWLWNIYLALDRKYKKNLKALFIVHPTAFIKVVLKFFKPFISVKFGRKIQHLNFIHELQPFLDVQKLSIPSPVFNYDFNLSGNKHKHIEPKNMTEQTSSQWEPSRQFGSSLEFILANSGTDVKNFGRIPSIVVQFVDFLSQPECLDQEGIFRISVQSNLVRQMEEKINSGENIVLVAPGDVYTAAVLLKAFFRELVEPLLTYKLYDLVAFFNDMIQADRLDYVRMAICKKLNRSNFHVLRYLLSFLDKVVDHSNLNKMTPSNLAVVFGPNIIWPEDQKLSLDHIAPINAFTEFLINKQEQIFQETTPS